ncbi:universal stress protein [Brachybacterium subflavum]|uniref:universal stress protein n=1 Tax=Brachybacterium subflavum TaxID=2585206 RepID=UPI001266640E|nr:universal stress protein [Brachybacterium subflavum]
MSTKATETMGGAAEEAGGAGVQTADGGAAAPTADGGEGRGPILVGVSATSGSPAALRWALEQARLQSLPLLALRAYRVPTTAAGTVRPTPSRVADSEDPLRSAALETLEGDVRRALGASADEVELRAVRGSRRRVLLDASAGASMLVIDAPRRREVRSDPTFAAQLVHRALCPVVIMPGPLARDAARQGG